MKIFGVEINIKNNAKETEKDFENLNDTLDETTKANDKVNESFDKGSSFAERYGKELEPLTTRMGEAEDRLYELALAGDTTSKEYQELLTSVGNYRKVQIETDLAVDGAATTMSQKLGSALTGATSGFAVTQGAMALVGSESQALEKSLLKVQAALAIQQGVDGLRTSYKELGGATGIATKAQAAFNFVIGLNLFVKIAAAITVVIALVQKFTGFLDPAIEKFKEFSDFIGLTDFEAEEAAKNEKKRAEEERKRIQETIQLNKDLGAEKRRQFIAEKKRIETIKRLKQEEFDLDIALLESQGRNTIRLRKQRAKELLDEAKENEEIQRQGGFRNLGLFREAQQQRIKAQIVFNNILREIREANAEEEVDFEIDAEIALQQELAKIKRANEDALRTDEENELLRVEEKYDALEASAFGNAEALNEIEIARLNARNEILLKYDNEAYDADQAAKEKQAAADKKAADKKIETAQAVADAEKRIQDAQFAAVEAGIGLLKQFADKNKGIQATVIAAESAVGIAKIIMNTQAANAAVTAKNALIPAPVGPLLTASEITANKVSAALGVATTIAAAAKGISALGGGASPASGGSLGGDGGGGGQAPSFNVVGDSGINQLAQLQQQPVQAFVVSGEVTTSQALDRNRVENATL